MLGRGGGTPSPASSIKLSELLGDELRLQIDELRFAGAPMVAGPGLSGNSSPEEPAPDVDRRMTPTRTDAENRSYERRLDGAITTGRRVR